MGMVNGIDRVTDFFYTPLQPPQTGEQLQGLDKTAASADTQSKDPGPGECKT